MSGPGPAVEGPGLYVHVPFCARACPYCDFDFVVGQDAGLEARIETWVHGLDRELELRRAELSSLRRANAVIDTLYFGGGTPSLVSPVTLGRVLSSFEQELGVEPSALREFTLECNPEHVEAAYLDGLVELGVDRISLGVQSLSREGLRQLGRVHDVDQALAAVAACVERSLRTTVDLIVGWPGQDEAGLRAEIEQLVTAGVEHLSIYSLTIEPDTPWPKLVRRGLRVLPNEDTQADLLLVAAEVLERLGFVHYEVASYARPGAEAVHNGKYWRWADVIALGPSAASVAHAPGRVSRSINPRGLESWLAGAAVEREQLTGDKAAAEGLWLGLRRLDGLEIARFSSRFAVDGAWIDDRIARQIELGNLVWSEGRERLGIAADRWLWHDSVALALLEG